MRGHLMFDGRILCDRDSLGRAVSPVRDRSARLTPVIRSRLAWASRSNEDSGFDRAETVTPSL